MRGDHARTTVKSKEWESRRGEGRNRESEDAQEKGMVVASEWVRTSIVY